MRFLRSPREYEFRLRQEMSNLRLLLSPPQLRTAPQPPPLFPACEAAVDQMRGTAFAEELIAIAEAILKHQFPVLGTALDTGSEIHWRRDYSRRVETDTRYFRRIPFLDAVRAGDHKLIWELNRHQHLVVLAQASLLTGEHRYVECICRQLESWFRENPFQRGINWASALEVALRALSWVWVYHLAGSRLPDGFLEWLYWHGCHLEANLSRYFSPNTHLLGEAVALHALGRMFGVKEWEHTGAAVVDQQAERQVRADGSHFEQSSYYHVYALDMFLFHALLRPETPPWRAKLERMAEYLRALIGPGRRLAFLGDDDGGRFFHPYGPCAEFGCATLATCSRFLNRPDLWAEHEDLLPQAVWWLGLAALDARPSAAIAEPESRLFQDSGVAVMTAGTTHVIADAGPFGLMRSGHSHSDTLSIVVTARGEEILIDPGTYTYVEPGRDWFRGSSAHNTIRIDGRDQAVPVNAFRWADPPRVRIREWATGAQQDFLDAECSYAGFVHRRRILFVKPDLLFVVDDIEGPAGEHTLEQFWHPGETVTRTGSGFRIGSRNLLVLDGEGLLENGWRSCVFGRREPAPVIHVLRRCPLPARFGAGLLLNAHDSLEILPSKTEFQVEGKLYRVK